MYFDEIKIRLNELDKNTYEKEINAELQTIFAEHEYKKQELLRCVRAMSLEPNAKSLFGLACYFSKEPRARERIKKNFPYVMEHDKTQTLSIDKSILTGKTSIKNPYLLVEYECDKKRAMQTVEHYIDCLKKETKKIEIDQELEKLLTSLPNYAKRELSSYIYELIGKDRALEDTREVKYLIGLLCTGTKLSFPKAFLKRLRKKLIRK